MKKHVMLLFLLCTMVFAPLLSEYTPMVTVVKNIVHNFPAQSIGHSIKVSVSTSYDVVSYMVTGKMKWVTFAAALYIYIMVQAGKKDRKVEVHNEPIVKAATSKDMASTSSSNSPAQLPLLKSLPSTDSGAGLFTLEERAELAK